MAREVKMANMLASARARLATPQRLRRCSIPLHAQILSLRAFLRVFAVFGQLRDGMPQ
jgi:hypothetical protein